MMNFALNEGVSKELNKKPLLSETKETNLKDFKELTNIKEISASKNELNELKKYKESLGKYIEDKFNECDLECKEVEKIKGNICERFMDDFYGKDWQRIEGERGVNGIDGLYIKRDKDGNIKDVLIVECKYNTSQLKRTQHGMQMSKNWTTNAVENLIKEYPENQDYKQILEKVQSGDYRTRLFRLIERGDYLDINIKKIESTDGEINVINVKSNERLKIGNGKLLDMQNPANEYETNKAKAYQKIREEEIDKMIKKSQGE